MTVNDYLNHVHALRLRAEHLRQKYEEKKSAATSTGSGLMIGGPAPVKGRNTHEKKIIAMLDAAEAYKLAALDYLEARQDLFAALMELENIDEAGVLVDRFINELPINEICEKYGSRSQVFRYIRAGKEHLREILRRSGVDIE